MSAVEVSGDSRRLIRVGGPQRTDGKLFRHPVDIAANHPDVIERAVVELVQILGCRATAEPPTYDFERIGAVHGIVDGDTVDNRRNVGARDADIPEHAVFKRAQLAISRAPLAPSDSDPDERSKQITEGGADSRRLPRGYGLCNCVDIIATHTDVIEHPVIESLQAVDYGPATQGAQDRRHQAAQGAPDGLRRNGPRDGGRRNRAAEHHLARSKPSHGIPLPIQVPYSRRP